MSEQTIEELQASIKTYRKTVGKLPFSHNMIGLLLGQIARQFGDDKANETIKTCKLDKLGWTVKP